MRVGGRRVRWRRLTQSTQKSGRKSRYMGTHGGRREVQGEGSADGVSLAAQPLKTRLATWPLDLSAELQARAVGAEDGHRSQIRGCSK